jgi:hypothetical protein
MVITIRWHAYLHQLPFVIGTAAAAAAAPQTPRAGGTAAAAAAAATSWVRR